MNQFSLENRQVRLKVAKSPILVRFFFFLITFCFFTLPLLEILLNINTGNGIKFIQILGIGFFSLIGFYLLRISLWNHCGEEIIQFNDNKIEYIADYAWFKDRIKSIENNSIKYSIKSVGYEDENKGVLIISNEKSKIESSIKMPKKNLEELIELLHNY